MNTTSENSKHHGVPRLLQPIRNQVEMTVSSLDELISQDHKVRLVWKYVEKLDLSEFLMKINSVEGSKGRPAINPNSIEFLIFEFRCEYIGRWGKMLEVFQKGAGGV